MKLVLYSGGSDKENRKLDKKLRSMLPKNPLVTYIPSSSLDSDIYFRYFVERFKKFGMEKFIHFPVDIPSDPVLEAKIWKSDMIHLDGGNTFYFLASLRRKGFLGKLRKFVQRGGILTGESAGAIIQTPNIDTAKIPSFDCDDNDVRLKDLSALKLVPFEFAPHFVNSKRHHDTYIKHTRKTNQHLYACKDGAGIVIDGKDLHLYGDIICFFNGKKLP